MPKENQRVMISKCLLKEGLMTLLKKKKNIYEISVSELCEKSGINRTTFYRHYQTPHDLLLEIEFEFVNEFYESPESLTDTNDIKKLAVRMCSFLYDNKELVTLFIKNNTDSDFTRIFRNLFDDLFAFREIKYQNQVVDIHTLHLVTTFFAYGIYSLIKQWIIEDIPKTPVEIADLIIGSFNRDFTFH